MNKPTAKDLDQIGDQLTLKQIMNSHTYFRIWALMNERDYPEVNELLQECGEVAHEPPQGMK